MVEIEAKVPISKGEFMALKKRLSTEAEPLGETVCRDTYYGHARQATVRLRNRGGEHTLELKRRQTIRGIESNLELSWAVSDAPKWKAMLRRWGIPPVIRKVKRSLRFRKKDFIIELNHVRLLGYYLEIECLTKEEKRVGEAKKELVALFRRLGYRETQFEARPYLELLTHV